MQTKDSTAEALLFITGLLVEGRATADAAATLKVLGHLAQEPQPGSEDAFVAVLQTASLQGISLSCLPHGSLWPKGDRHSLELFYH